MENCLLGKSLEEINQCYRKSINMGGWFSFNSTPDQWLSGYASSMLNHFFNMEFIERAFSGYQVSRELLITKNLNFSGIQDKSVLVVGAGPSTLQLTQEIISSYDYVFSCNHFFKSDLLKNTKVNLALIGDEVDLDSKQFNEYLERYQPVIGFEHSGKRPQQQLVEFRRRYPKCFVYLTRYFSRLGYVPRAIILAALASPSKIDYIGMDGFKKGAYAHCFEPNKPPPPFDEEEMFKQQMEIFLKYLLYDVKVPKESIDDLGAKNKSSIYSGMLGRIKNEKN